MTFLLRLLLALACAIGAASAPARPDRPDAPLADDAARLPAGVDLVVIVDRAADRRHEPLARAAVAMLRRAGILLTPEFEARWKALADTLGLSPEDTFDALLGRRVIVVADGLDGPSPRWALLSHVSIHTEELLLRRLRVAPRQIVADQRLLAVEGGRYELAVRRADPDAPAASPAAQILLAPREHAGLLDQLIPALSGRAPAAPLAGTPAHAAALELGPCHALLIFQDRSAPGADAPPPTEPRFAVLASRADGHDLHTRVLALRGPRAGSDPGLADVPPWSGALTSALANNAVAATVELIPEPGVLQAGLPVPMPAPVLDALERAGPIRGSRWAFAARAADSGALDFIAAVETRDAAAFARFGDDLVARLVTWTRANGPDAHAPPPDFAGMFPRAARSCSILGPATEPLRAVLAGTPSLSWCSAVDPDGTGWWIVRLSATEPDAARTLALRDLFEHEPHDADSRPRLSVGVLSPRRLAPTLSLLSLPDDNPLHALEAVESASWDLSFDESGRVVGSVLVRLVPPPEAANEKSRPKRRQ